MFLRYLFGVFALLGWTSSDADTPQQHVHEHSHEVMPFDMSSTVHIFKMTERGGVQSVVVRGAAEADQIKMIQAHLKHEFERFAQGDYADPATLHGAGMPGLAEVQTNAGRIKVAYEALPNGAALTFDTTDVHALTAIHRWFGAQLSEHGADARAE